MNSVLIIEPKAIEVKIIEDHAIWTLLEDGREIVVPIAWYPRLSKATKQELNNFRIIGRGSGIHWEDLDEDLLFDEELDPPFELPSTTNKTATITTAASVTNTIMAVRRKARGMLYSSYP